MKSGAKFGRHRAKGVDIRQNSVYSGPSLVSIPGKVWSTPVEFGGAKIRRARPKFGLRARGRCWSKSSHGCAQLARIAPNLAGFGAVSAEIDPESSNFGDFDRTGARLGQHD